MEKKKYISQKLYPFIIFSLIILLLISIILNIFFYNQSQKRLFDCTLGEDIEVEYDETDSIILANILYPSNVVSGTKYKQKVVLKTNDISRSYFVRAKAVYADHNIVNEKIEVSLSPSTNWEIGANNYFYLKAKISDFEEIEFIDSITIPKTNSSIKNNTTITIIFDFLDTNFDVESLWNMPNNFFE